MCVCVCVWGGGGARFADFISFFLNIPCKWNNLVSLRPNYFNFIGYLKSGGEGGSTNLQNPLWIRHWHLMWNEPADDLGSNRTCAKTSFKRTMLMYPTGIYICSFMKMSILFYWSLHAYFMDTSNESSGESAHLHLPAFVARPWMRWVLNSLALAPICF